MRASTLCVTFFALFCGLVASSTEANAQQQAMSTSTTAKQAAPSPFSIAAGLSKTASLIDHQDGSRQESNDLEVIPSYTFSWGKTLAVFAFSDDLRDPGNSDMDDIIVGTAFKGWEFKTFKLAPSVSFVIPESKDSRINKNLETAISGKLTAAVQKSVLLPGLDLGAFVSFGRNFHRYDTALDGKVLNQYSSKQGFSAGYSIGIVSLSIDFTHINAWTYQGNLKEAYQHGEELGLALGEHFGLAVGLSNGPGASVFKQDGYSSNYQFIDENNTLAYAKVSMQY
jgi:hypothetical protein